MIMIIIMNIKTHPLLFTCYCNNTSVVGKKNNRHLPDDKNMHNNSVIAKPAGYCLNDAMHDVMTIIVSIISVRGG
jgi:hypothetical protein